MKNKISVAKLFGVSAVLLAALPLSAGAQENWPDGPLNIIVAFAAGGGSDRQARVLAGPLEEQLGVPVTVQNLPGGGGQVAATVMLREPTDAPVMLAINEPDLTMADVIGNAPFSRSDFEVIAVDVVDPRILMVANDSPFQSFAEFVDTARENPGELTIATAQGNAQELFAKWMAKALDIDVRIVGYSGGSEAANAMLGGHVSATLGDDFSRLNIRGESRALMVAAPQESPRWPEAETLVEALAPYDVEVPAPDFLARYGVYAVQSAFQQEYPERYERLQQAILAAMESDAYLQSVEASGLDDLSLRAPGEEYAESFRATEAALLEATGE
ncbi:Bug family tripartite tricarboxylate transporter substrate binding protein [Billgrantia endophytica]|uniref:Tripartite tricarboxylate transporter substrate binding protein n=1 Tax=Billgrantia endophytica TaxID=2033802 RepID=A0A2N7U7R0_9GAMM|nr:tripartite tricarboxylate transporter substrate binding protein [Halomonas endophytica]PMR76480.1 hypothetical protein C1H69_05400 [Halomonas endophytica]